MSCEVSVIIPTLRERENLARLLPRLFDVLQTAGLNAEVLVIDDDSRDGTNFLCRSLSRWNQLRLITRYTCRGLATAVLAGIRNARGCFCVVMDADLSHPPEIVPLLVAAVQSPDCDVAIGSRYTTGGCTDANWGRLRRLNSGFATFLASGLTDAADPLAGFFAIRRETVLQATSLRPLGLKVLLELIVRCDCRRIVEIPIVFQNRTVGSSKLSMTQQGQYLRHLARLYMYRLSRMIVRRRTIEPVLEPPLSPLHDATTSQCA